MSEATNESPWDPKPGRLRGVLSDCPAMGEAGRTITDADGRFAGSGRTIVEALHAFTQAAVEAGIGRAGEHVDVVLRDEIGATG